MISHKYKCIFIHIPKCAGSSIFKFLNPNLSLDWREPNYEVLFGWCPKRQLHLQHATAKQLLETDLITEKQWTTYFKFTFVRNPWDRALSDYIWMQKDRNAKGSFKDFLLKRGVFEKVLRDDSNMSYRGDHLLSQSSFFDLKGFYALDYIGRFENLEKNIVELREILAINEEFNQHEKKSKSNFKHYSFFYTKSKKRLVEDIYFKDIERFGYDFSDQKRGIQFLKNYF